MISNAWLWMTWSGIPKPTDEQCEATRKRVTRACVVCGRYGLCWIVNGLAWCDNRALYGSCEPINEEDESNGVTDGSSPSALFPHSAGFDTGDKTWD